MNILIITQMLWEPEKKGDNGVTKTVNYFARDWHKLGHNVVVVHCPSKFPLAFYYVPDFIKHYIQAKKSMIVPSKESRNDTERDESGVKVFHFPMYKIFPGCSFSENAMKEQKNKIIATLDKIHFKPNLVVGHFANPSAELVSGLAKHYESMSSVVFHYDCTSKTLFKYRLQEACAGIKAIGVRSYCEAKAVKKLLHLNEEPFVCFSGVPDKVVGSSENNFDKYGSDGDLEFLCVGEMIGRKNFDTVLKAFAKIYQLNPQVHLTLVGDGPLKSKLMQLAHNLHLGDAVSFTGKIPRNEVMQYMRSAHVFTLVSSGEVFGMVYIEAMLQGCLTIASLKGGFDGIIQDGYNGFLSQAGNEDNLFEVYKKIISLTKKERLEIANNAKKYASEFSESAVAARYLNDILIRNR